MHVSFDWQTSQRVFLKNYILKEEGYVRNNA